MHVLKFDRGDAWTTADGRIRTARAPFWAVVDDDGCVMREDVLTASAPTKREAEAIMRRLESGKAFSMAEAIEFAPHFVPGK